MDKPIRLRSMRLRSIRLGSMRLGAAVLGGMLLAANAQPRYWPYAFNPAQAAAPSWYYNPYTSGLGPCPQRMPSDPRCAETILPSYGQPDYWRR